MLVGKGWQNVEFEMINCMKRLLVSAVLVVSGFAAVAQQDAQFSQNMFNKLSVNPGVAGENGGICGMLLHRSQWFGL